MTISAMHGVATALITPVLTTVADVLLSVKRTVTAALCNTVDACDLGPKSAESVFAELFDIADDEAHGSP